MSGETFLPWPAAAAVALDGMKLCECGCGPLPATSRCRRRRLEGRIATLTRRLDWQRENRGTKGFRTTWEERERLRAELAELNARTLTDGGVGNP